MSIRTIRGWLLFFMVPAVLLSGWPWARACFADAPQGLEAGAAAININPIKLPVSISGMFYPRKAGKVHEDLHARCLVLKQGDMQVAIMTVDSVRIVRAIFDPVKELASQATGIPTDRMLLAATHTHSAPGVSPSFTTPVEEEYKAQLMPLLVRTIVQAHKNLEPAEVGWGVADAADLTNNRRWIYRSDRIGTDPFGEKNVWANMHPPFQSPDTIGPSGPIDPDLSLLAVRSTGGRPIALLANFSQHYFGAEPISADYFGVFCRKFAERVGQQAATADGSQRHPPFVAMLSQGTSGDLFWADYSKPKKSMTLDQYSEQLLDRAWPTYEGIQYTADLPLAMRESHLIVRRNVPDAARLAWAKAVIAKMGDRPPNGLPEIFAKHAILLDEDPHEWELIVQAMRIGDLAIAAWPGEVYAITGLRTKLQSPFGTTINICQANDGNSYFPPLEQYALGGYTTWPCQDRLVPGTEARVSEAELKLLEELAGKPRKPLVEPDCRYSQAVLQSKPAAYYRLGEMMGHVAHDRSGNGRNGKLEAGYALYLEGPGGAGLNTGCHGNRCVHLAGGRLQAEVPVAADKYSVEFWFWNGFPNDARAVTAILASKGSTDDAHSTSEQLGIGGTLGSPGCLFAMSGDRQRKVTLTGHARIEPKTWNHVAWVHDGNQVRVYLNGHPEPEITGAVESLSDAPPSGWIFGGRTDGFANLEGKLDEIAIYPRALLAAEIAAHVEAACGKPSTSGGG